MDYTILNMKTWEGYIEKMKKIREWNDNLLCLWGVGRKYGGVGRHSDRECWGHHIML